MRMVIKAVGRCGARKTLAALLLPLGAAAFDPAMAQSQKASELTPSPPGASVYFVELKDGATVPEKLRIPFGGGSSVARARLSACVAG